MTAIPAALSIEQGRNVCRALGLPPSLVREVRVTPGEGAEATLFMRDREGRRIQHGDDLLTATVRIPFIDHGQEVSDDGTPRG
ncbi:hypothetical protein ACIBAC_15135 [Streptomyces sp. NPDC051362]|uniref:hypothetical protein n=1 Tax=Streptomyces sp. NPDC051362 TaxID=3365651 RepID=UPI00378D20B5